MTIDLALDAIDEVDASLDGVLFENRGRRYLIPECAAPHFEERSASSRGAVAGRSTHVPSRCCACERLARSRRRRSVEPMRVARGSFEMTRSTMFSVSRTPSASAGAPRKYRPAAG